MTVPVPECPRHGSQLVDDCPGCRVIRIKRMEEYADRPYPRMTTDPLHGQHPIYDDTIAVSGIKDSLMAQGSSSEAPEDLLAILDYLCRDSLEVPLTHTDGLAASGHLADYDISTKFHELKLGIAALLVRIKQADEALETLGSRPNTSHGLPSGQDSTRGSLPDNQEGRDGSQELLAKLAQAEAERDSLELRLRGALAKLVVAERERDEARAALGKAQVALSDLTPSEDGGYGPDNARAWKDAYIARLQEATTAERKLAEAEAERDEAREALTVLRENFATERRNLQHDIELGHAAWKKRNDDCVQANEVLRRTRERLADTETEKIERGTALIEAERVCATQKEALERIAAAPSQSSFKWARKIARDALVVTERE